MQVGDPFFSELMTIPAEELYETITQEQFVELIKSLQDERESQVMKVAEAANNFKYKWHNLNSRSYCIKFHNHHRPSPTGHGSQAATPESEMYNNWRTHF